MLPYEPLISVIVPIYQIDRYIGICIESIINQTYRNLEIILVDDGSTDRCQDICDLYAEKDKRIKVIHKANGGLVSARKAGVLSATGKYIGYVDGDDWIAPEYYECLLNMMEAHHVDLVAVGYSRDIFGKSEQFDNNIPIGVYEYESLDALYSKMISFGEFYRPGIATYVWNKLFKREILLPHQLKVDERITIGEDAALTYPVLTSCKRVYVGQNYDYHYRQREDSMLKKNEIFQKEAINLKYLYEYLKAYAEEQPAKYKIHKQADDYVLSICCIRSGGILKNADSTYSVFNKDFTHKDIAIYSAGTFGQQLISRFNENQHCNVTSWVDDDYWEYRRCCLNVDPVESIINKHFDYVLIASVDSQVVAIIMKRLTDLGVNTQQILTVQCPEESRKELIYKYLY